LQVILWITQNADAFLDSQEEQLRGLYGEPSGEGDVPHNGPFSLKTYLQYMVLNHTWGDQCIITALSMMLHMAISVLNIRGGRVIHLPFRHSGPLEEARLVLLYNGVTHYSAAGNRLQ
jgi:hypothetical protein